MIDTGAPISIIDRSSVGTFGLKVESTKVGVGRVFGPSGERFGLSEISTLAMGNCVLANVPVAVADEADMNEYTRLAHLDGLFGAHEMRKFGAVINSGLLGIEHMSLNFAVIDLGSMSLYLRHPDKR